jgi:uncharacterized membrane protein SpoIIM required for sporulation
VNRDYASRLKEWGWAELRIILLAIAVGSLLGALSAFMFLENESQAKETLTFLHSANHRGLAFVAHWRLHFWHNLKIATVVIVSGVVWRWIPILISSLNAYAVGLSCTLLLMHYSITFIDILSKLGPHGVLEIPALVTASIAGARIPRVAKGRTLGFRLQVLIESWKVALAVMAVLCLAAAVEARTN